MTARRISRRASCCAVIGLLVLAAGCATDAQPSAKPPHTTTSKPSAKPKQKSGFCLDLSTFNVGVIEFASKVGAAIEHQPVDFREVRRLNALISVYEKEMRPSVPPDIAPQFNVVVAGVHRSARAAANSSHATIGDLVLPMYNKKAQAAQKALGRYQCH